MMSGDEFYDDEITSGLDRSEAAAGPRATDGLDRLLQEVLRKYGGTMKGRGDHDIYEALVRYRAAIAKAERR